MGGLFSDSPHIYNMHRDHLYLGPIRETIIPKKDIQCM